MNLPAMPPADDPGAGHLPPSEQQTTPAAHPRRRASDRPNTGRPAAMASSRSIRPDPEQLHALNTRAWNIRMSDPRLSGELGQTALRQAEALGDPAELIAALRTVALTDLHASHHRSALDRLNRTLELLNTHPDISLERDCKNLLACIYQNLFNSEKATALHLECLELARRMNHPDGEANALQNLGIVALQGLNDPQTAATYFNRALEIQKRTGNLRAQANTGHNLASALQDLKLWEQARAAALESIQAAQQSGIRTIEAASLNCVAHSYTETGQYALAAPLHDEAVKMWLDLEVDNPYFQGSIEVDRALNLIELNRHEEAETALIGTLRLLEDNEMSGTDLPAVATQVHRALANLYKRQGRFLDAMTHSETAFRIKEDYDRQQATERAQAMMMQFEVDRAQSEAELYRLRTEELGRVNAQLEAAALERATLLDTLQQQQVLLERQVREDALSGLYNRRHAEVLLDRAYREHHAEGTSFVVAMIDIDHFKRVNDGFSHQTGDEVIRVVGSLLKRHLREEDMVGRYGGEEFVMLLANTTLGNAMMAMERLRQTVQDHDWEQVAPGLRVTLSVGAAHNTGQPSWEKIVGAADVKLYEAKRTRNTVAC